MIGHPEATRLFVDMLIGISSLRVCRHDINRVNSSCFGVLVSGSAVSQADASVARNSLQAITVMATHHVSEKMKGAEGLSGQLALKPDIFTEVLRTLLHVR